MNELRTAIYFYVDRGAVRCDVLRQLAEDGIDTATAVAELEAMLDEELLTQGTARGYDDLLVVTAWCPGTVERMRLNRCAVS